MASAERSLPSRSAISPNTSPGCRIASSSSLPSGDEMLMRTSPLSTAIMLEPGAPMWKMLSPAANRRTWARVTSSFRSSSPSPWKMNVLPRSRRASSVGFRFGVSTCLPARMPRHARDYPSAGINTTLLRHQVIQATVPFVRDPLLSTGTNHVGRCSAAGSRSISINGPALRQILTERAHLSLVAAHQRTV